MNHKMTDRKKEYRPQGIVKLSQRLRRITDFVKEGSKIADIGTDHGFVPVYLAQMGRIQSALAMDVRTGPLERAREHIREYERWAAEHSIEACSVEARLSDGLKGLKRGEADTVIIAGMGGELEIRILEEGRHLWDSIKHWILSPQSDLDQVRHYLEDNGFAVVEEAMVKEEGKFYTIMSLVQGRMKYERPMEYLYGRCLIEKKDPVLREYLDQESRRIRNICESLQNKGRKQMTEGRLRAYEALVQELAWIKEAQDEMW